MSERQSKLKRKNENTQTDVVKKKKKSKAEIITNMIICVAVIAVLGLGGWAIATKPQDNNTPAQDVTDGMTSSTPTIEQYAQSMGMTGEKFIKEYGLDEFESITPDTDLEFATEYMSLKNYAKLVNSDVETIKAEMGIDENVKEETAMGEIFYELQQKAEAQQNQDDENAEKAEENTAE